MNNSCWSCNLTEDVLRNETGDWPINETEKDVMIAGSWQAEEKSAVILFLAMITSFRIALGCSAAILNYFLLCSLSRVDHSTLKVKVLIQTTAIANIILPLVAGLKPDVFIAPFRKMDANLSLCTTVVFQTTYTLALYVQSSCNLGLACDRLYAVIRPLQYHTTGYHKAVRFAMVIGPVFMALLLYGTFVALSLRMNPTVPQGLSPACVIFHGAQKIQLYSDVVANFLLLCNCTAFVMFVSVLAVLRHQRAKIKRVSESSVKRDSAVLSVTYLLTNLSTLLLYSPAPLFSLFFPRSEIMRVFTTMYFAHSSFVPLILMLRIPSIRKNLPFKSRVRARGSTTAKKTHPTSNPSQTHEIKTPPCQTS